MSSRSSVFRAICLLFFVFLSACHALTVDEGEQVAMVMDKIEKAAATRKQQQGQQQQQQQRQLALTGAISVAAGCFNDWASLVLAGPFSNNTALYLCDGFSNALPILASLTIPAGIDVTISCLGVCVATGGGLINGFFDVQAGGRLDLFGIDFDNVAGVS